MNETLTENDQADLKAGLRRCSQATINAALRYREKADLTVIPVVIRGILERYQTDTATVDLSAANDSARLIEDLGLDSLTLLELALSLEEALGIPIRNDQIRELQTFGELNQFLRKEIERGHQEKAGKSVSLQAIS